MMVNDSTPATGSKTAPPESADSDPRADEHLNQEAGGVENDRGQVDPGWARRQRTLAIVGAALALVALGCTLLGLIGYPPDLGAPTWQLYLAVTASAVLALCCVILATGWLRGSRSWRAEDRADLSGLIKLCFAAHLLSYMAVLFAMYGTVATSALVGWNSSTGTMLGIAFMLVIAAQTIGGTQYVRSHGPPGTVPNYLRMLNTKVQSLR